MRGVSPIFDFKKYRNLEIRATEGGTIRYIGHDFLLVFYKIFCLYLFEICDIKNAMT